MRSCYRDQVAAAEVRRWCAERIAAWDPDATVERVVAGDAETALLVSGSATSPTTVVVIAGDRFCSAASLPLLSTFGSRYRVVAADVPGQPGLSADRPGAATLDWYGRWLGDVLASTGPAYVVGHSFGGAIALACRDPGLLGRLTVSTGGLCRLALPPAVLADFVRWTVAPGPRSSARILARLLADGTPPRAELIEWMTLVARGTRPISSSAIADPSVSIPTTVATGAEDVFLPPARLRPAVRAVFQSELRVVPGAGHLVTEQAPEVLLALLDELVTAGR